MSGPRPVLAQAVVDIIGVGAWAVTVYNAEANRIYDIRSDTEDHAAQEGIRRFVEEMGAMQEGAAPS